MWKKIQLLAAHCEIHHETEQSLELFPANLRGQGAHVCHVSVGKTWNLECISRQKGIWSLMGTPALLCTARLCLCCSILILACLCQHQAHYHLPSVLLWQASAVSVSTLQKQRWMFSGLTSPRWLSVFSAITSNKDVNHNNPSDTQLGEESLLSFIHSFIPMWLHTCSSVCIWEHIPSYVCDLGSHRSLNTAPMSCIWIGYFSVGSDSWDFFFFFWGGEYFTSFPGRQLLLFPCLRLQQCSLVLRPPPLNVSTRVSTSPSHFLSLHLTVGFLPRGPLCLSAAHLHISLVYVSQHLYFCTVEWQPRRLVNILTHSQEPHNSSPSSKTNDTSWSKKSNNERVV